MPVFSFSDILLEYVVLKMIKFAICDDESLVIMTQGIKIPVSRLRERDMIQALMRYMKERNG